MKVAVIGSRNISVIDLEKYIFGADEIVSGGAVGVDACAEKYAKEKEIKLTVFLPQYKRYGRAAPIMRNKQIVDYADKVFAFWDGCSKGTLSVINYAKKVGKVCEVVICNQKMEKQVNNPLDIDKSLKT